MCSCGHLLEEHDTWPTDGCLKCECETYQEKQGSGPTHAERLLRAAEAFLTWLDGEVLAMDLYIDHGGEA